MHYPSYFCELNEKQLSLVKILIKIGSLFPMNLSLKKYKYANSHKTMSYKINLLERKTLFFFN